VSGFRRKRKVYKLDFTGTEYEGLEVKVSGLTTGEFLDLIRVTGSTGKEADSDATLEMLQMLAKHLISWNLLDEDEKPVPTTFDGMKTSDLALNMLIVDAWTTAVSGVSAPLEKPLISGETSPVESIPMEALSGSLQS